MQEIHTGKKRRDSKEPPPDMSEVNVMLLGCVGVGKSASGNTIIGDDTFKLDFSPAAVIRACELAQTEVNGQTITVIDTVGICDTNVEKITDIQTEIKLILQCTDLDVFLLVIKPRQSFIHESKRAVKWMQENFGAKIFQHTIVLFTHGDRLQKPIKDYLRKHEALQSVVDQCSGGFHVFSNGDKDRAQVAELLEKINRLREKNIYSRYTQWDYTEAQKNIRMKKSATGTKGGEAAAGAAVVGAALLAAFAVGKFGKGAAVGVVIKSVGLMALGGAALGAAVGAGIYFMAKQYTSKTKKD